MTDRKHAARQIFRRTLAGIDIFFDAGAKLRLPGGSIDAADTRGGSARSFIGEAMRLRFSPNWAMRLSPGRQGNNLRDLRILLAG
jgi:hypothetical protein